MAFTNSTLWVAIYAFVEILNSHQGRQWTARHEHHRHLFVHLLSEVQHIVNQFVVLANAQTYRTAAIQGQPIPVQAFIDATNVSLSLVNRLKNTVMVGDLFFNFISLVHHFPFILHRRSLQCVSLGIYETSSIIADETPAIVQSQLSSRSHKATVRQLALEAVVTSTFSVGCSAAVGALVGTDVCNCFEGHASLVHLGYLGCFLPSKPFPHSEIPNPIIYWGSDLD